MANLPSEYIQVEYIQADDAQFINTIVKPTNKTKIELKVSALNGNFFAATQYSSGRIGVYALTDGSVDIGFGSLYTKIASGVTYPAVITLENGKVTINGTNYTFATQSSFSGSDALRLFAEGSTPNGSGTLYYCKIWENGTLIRDYVPCIYTSAPTTWATYNGLYDLVNNNYMCNSGMGTFITGPVVEVPEEPSLVDYEKVKYIKSTGTQYINTGIIAEFPLEIEMQMETSTGVGSSDQILLGVSSALIHINPIYIYNGQWVLSAGGTDVISEKGSVADNTTYNIKAVLTNGSQTFALDGNTILESSNSTNGSAGVLYLFARNNNGTASNFSSANIYHVRIYRSGVLLRDFIPCINTSGEAGMYDLVGNQFYSNAGNGVFEYEKYDKGLYVGVPTFEKVNLPDGYTQVEYVESSGTQWINTKHYITSQNIRYVCKMAYTGDNSDSVSFGGGASNGYIVAMYQSSPAFWVGSSGSLCKITMENGVDHELDISANNGTLTVIKDGVSQTASYSGTMSATNPISIFAQNAGGSAGQFASIRVLYFKIYDNDVLVRDYIPCTNASGEAGLYDLVNNQFYKNAGTGVFTAGSSESKSFARKVTNIYVGVPEKYTVLDYIQSSGTQYIDSNFYPSGKALRIVTKFKYTSTHDGLSLFGNSTSGQFAITVYGSQPVFYVGTSNAVSCGPQTSLNTTYTLDVTANNGALTAIWNGATYTASYSGTLRTDRPMYIFGSNGGSGVAETGSGYLLESIQFYDNGTLVRDYIPCANEDGEYGLYDLVGKKFYSNAGTGTFTAGPVTSNNDDTIDGTSLARFVIKGYIGVDDIARPFWDVSGGGGSDEKTITYYGTIDSMTVTRYLYAAASVGGYALFGGGSDAAGRVYGTVDAYNTSLSRSNPAVLGSQRIRMAATNVGGYALFGGGYATSYTNVVDAYNTSLTRSDAQVLKPARMELAATTNGQYALFGGGYTGSVTDMTDAYNSSLTKTVPMVMNGARRNLGAASVGGYALFGGGHGNNVLATVDAYNTSLSRSNPTALSLARTFISAASTANHALIAGGSTSITTYVSGVTYLSNVVDVYDTSLTRTTPVTLSVARGYIAAASHGGYAIFAGGYIGGDASNVVDIFDKSLTRVATDVLSCGRLHHSAAVVGDHALFGGGPLSIGGWGQISDVSANVDVYTLV